MAQLKPNPPVSGALHAHVMLQFRVAVDKTASPFAFGGMKPNISPTDLCGEGLRRKKLQSSIDRGFFYVWANKVGAVSNTGGEPCVRGNYEPVWTQQRSRYQVLGAWPEKLWKQRKLTGHPTQTLSQDRGRRGLPTTNATSTSPAPTPTATTSSSSSSSNSTPTTPTSTTQTTIPQPPAPCPTQLGGNATIVSARATGSSLASLFIGVSRGRGSKGSGSGLVL